MTTGSIPQEEEPPSWWRELVRQGRYKDISWHHLSREDRVEYYGILTKVVPLLWIENGIEVGQRYAYPDEVEGADLKAAAMVLMLGELEEAVGPPIPTATEDWNETETWVREYIKDALSKPEPHSGSPELSRHAHAKACLEALDGVRFQMAALGGQACDEGERAWIIEAISDAGRHGFWAGRKLQAVWTKPHEADARQGKKAREGSKRGQANRRGKVAEHTNEVLRRMNDRIQVGQSIRNAAKRVFKDGFGRSAQANEKLWSRHRVRR